ncbi:deoxyribodipyrimidine photo-lyase [Nocardioides sp.]|uniref:cryptochrome/photolyase family protein n=1 Tax=Nocardioides sp. TaxID=35761 RepID=UPI003527E356
MASPTAAVMWFRRDLRLGDNPALLEACSDGAVLPLFVVDDALWRPSGSPRRVYLAASLRALDESLRELSGRLVLTHGDPVSRVVAAAREVDARRVHIAADYGPYGARRDEAAERALAEHDIELVRTGSPYAVAPGRVRNQEGNAYRVYTPFSKAWAAHGWRGPVDAPRHSTWLEMSRSAQLPDPGLRAEMELPEAGEQAARRRWREFFDSSVDDYAADRDRPDLDATSRLSVHLKWGEIHPRTLLADLGRKRSKGAETFRKELAWREFYADVLFHRPDSARDYLRSEFARMDYDDPGEQLQAWKDGRTGYPIVDAGMRQLARTGWMHNRVRMIVASFLVKDLHVEWQHGARHFMEHLVDGDLASNQHGWQWVAGCGTDAAPYFRIFNPTTQGRRFDPDGDYVRRWVPELADVADPHEPGQVAGYPAPIVDHATERDESLARYERIRAT